MRSPAIRAAALVAAVLLLLAPVSGVVRAQPSFLTFESGPVRPLALSPNGRVLFAANTPDGRLEIFSINSLGLTHVGSVPVGLEPVAVAARTDDEVWVVNHLSDSVSVVDVPSRRVVRTLLVGDEPRDVVFAGPGGNRAFVTTAHRGQHRTHPSIAHVPGAGDPQLTTPGVGRADVWVFDALDLDGGSAEPTVGGVPVRILVLFGDTPRALAVNRDGTRVWAAVFHSGNQTAVVAEGVVCNGFGTATCQGDGITSPGGLPGGLLPGGSPGPATNHAGVPAPEVGLVVEYDETSGEWHDELGRNWSNGIRFHLPDHDVFAIDSESLVLEASHDHVGTILFNMVQNPETKSLYVSNTEAQNLTRFEGPGQFGGSTVMGDLHRARLTVIRPDGSVLPRHLNPHIDYAQRPAPPGTKEHSLATPTDMVVSSDGRTLYVAAFGSGKVGVLDTGKLEAGSLDPLTDSGAYIPVSGGGPGGLVLDEKRGRLYVLTRFDNSISVVDVAEGAELAHLPLHNPEPAHVVEGRPFLYDALGTSSNGEASCSSCHVFADFDGLAWDLGNPDEDVTFNPQQINIELGAIVVPPSPINGTSNPKDFHPMKGPMTTQTLRGMVNSGHMHWRGDRVNGFFGLDDPNTLDTQLSFNNFIVAFPGLVGGALPPTDPQLQADMQKFTDFALEIVLPPNPVRRLDNQLRDTQSPAEASEFRGREFYMGNVGSGLSDGISVPGFGFSCNGCHELDPAQGFFGTGGAASFENEPQIIKIPHLRNLYQKIGMFGAPANFFINPGDNGHKGDQVRGTGFLHDGAVDTLFRFFQATVFDGVVDPLGTPVGFLGGDDQRRDVEAFMLAFPSDLAPVVGQQVTLDARSGSGLHARVDLLIQRAQAPFVSKLLGGTTTECDLVVKGRVDGEARGFLFDAPSGLFLPDRAAEAPLTDGQLRDLALGGTPSDAGPVGQELTYTCVPPGSGVRAALDRDLDGRFDGDERDDGTDPADPGSVTGACGDGIDNDGDGAVDLADQGCADAGASDESPECDDGIDNDGDGLVDVADAGCAAPSGAREKDAEPRCGLLGLEALAALGLARGWRRRRDGRAVARA